MNISDSRDFVAGTFVWSGFDYLGESRGWPQTVKCRGVVADAAGFLKESYWWMRSWWLSRVPLSDPGRPPLADARTCYIPETWHAGVRANGTALPAVRTVHVYTDAPLVRLELNGAVVAPPTAVPPFGNAQFSVRFAPGNLTAVALDASGRHVLASYSALTHGVAVALRLSLDAPSAATGTGTAVVADGEDVAMVRAEVVDASGRLVADASHEVTFEVVSGGGAVWGTHSGNPADLHPHLPARRAYHGLARCIVRSTADAATLPWHRARLREIDLDGGERTTVADPATDGARAAAADCRARERRRPRRDARDPGDERSGSARCGRSRRRIKIVFRAHRDPLRGENFHLAGLAAFVFSATRNFLALRHSCASRSRMCTSSSSARSSAARAPAKRVRAHSRT